MMKRIKCLELAMAPKHAGEEPLFLILVDEKR
jgi:hypothetical protein